MDSDSKDDMHQKNKKKKEKKAKKQKKVEMEKQKGAAASLSHICRAGHHIATCLQPQLVYYLGSLRLGTIML